MGGTIRVADREGGGTIFHIVLSLVRAIDHAPQALATLGQIAPADDIRPAAKSFHELNVLIVDDDEINQLLLVTLLTKMGHRVICAHDGRQAVKLASSQIFDLVLMDIRMPVLNGKYAIAELRSNSGPTTDGLPIFVMTANVMDQEVAQYREVGADQVLAKPIDFGQLRQLVATLEPRTRPQSGFGASAHHTIDKAILGGMISLVGTQGAKRALRQMATTTPVLFQVFDHAVATGDEIARQRTVERLAQVLEAFGAKSLVERAIALTPATRIELEAEIHEAMTYLSGLLDEEVQRAFA
jgi:CheY-like chemotaxis protein